MFVSLRHHIPTCSEPNQEWPEACPRQAWDPCVCLSPVGFYVPFLLRTPTPLLCASVLHDPLPTHMLR